MSVHQPASDPARRAAYELLRAVRVDGAYANIAWPGILDQHRLTGRDAGFATELAYGALRWAGRHDAILAACVDRDPAAVQPELRDAMRLGVHQLQAMRVGPHAAVSETVGLVRAVLNPGAAGFANAVLRRVAAGGTASQWIARLVGTGAVPDRDSDQAAHLAVTTSHPRWTVVALHEALSASDPHRTWDDTEAELLAENEPAGVTLVARTLARDELARRMSERGLVSHPGTLSPRALRVQAVNPGALPEVATGAAGVQDEGSQVVALALAGAPLTGPDSRWLDMCAGPGGKAAVLADAVAGRGGSLTAVELHEHRARLVRSALRPIRGQHEVLCADALTADIGAGYDRVLLDAPCTGLGALRRRPESRWRRSPADLVELTALQRALLRRALHVVRPGGLVLYVTCSPHLAETEAIVDDAPRIGGEVLDLREQLAGSMALPASCFAGPHLRLWPRMHDTDGMFAALIRRR